MTAIASFDLVQRSADYDIHSVTVMVLFEIASPTLAIYYAKQSTYGAKQDKANQKQQLSESYIYMWLKALISAKAKN